MEIPQLKRVRFYTLKLLIEYLVIRYKVYIGEFGRRITEEFSLEDVAAEHYIFMTGRQKIGTARILYKGVVAELGRVAIRKEYRNQGYGTEMINLIIARIGNSRKANLISLYAADRRLTKYYRKLGFTENGETYFDNIPYVNMVKAIPSEYMSFNIDLHKEEKTIITILSNLKYIDILQGNVVDIIFYKVNDHLYTFQLT